MYSFCVLCGACWVALVLCFIEKVSKLGFESLGFGLLELGKEEKKVFKVSSFMIPFSLALWSTARCFFSCYVLRSSKFPTSLLTWAFLFLISLWAINVSKGKKPAQCGPIMRTNPTHWLRFCELHKLPLSSPIVSASLTRIATTFMLLELSNLILSLLENKGQTSHTIMILTSQFSLVIISGYAPH